MFDIVDTWGVIVKPEPMPAVKGKNAKKFLKDLEVPLSPEKLAFFKEAELVSKKIKPAKKQLPKKIVVTTIKEENENWERLGIPEEDRL